MCIYIILFIILHLSNSTVTPPVLCTLCEALKLHYIGIMQLISIHTSQLCCYLLGNVYSYKREYFPQAISANCTQA